MSIRSNGSWWWGGSWTTAARQRDQRWRSNELLIRLDDLVDELLELPVGQLSPGLLLDPFASEPQRFRLGNPEATGDSQPLDLAVADHSTDRLRRSVQDPGHLPGRQELVHAMQRTAHDLIGSGVFIFDRV